MAISTSGCEIDRFKLEYKHYKRRKPPPNYSNVVNFNDTKTTNETVLPYKLNSVDSKDFHLKLGLKAPEAWQCFIHKQCPGLIFIRNPFLPGHQRYWVRQCLREYTKKPNKSNLDQSVSSKEFENILGNKELAWKLRWVTLGYQYDWTNKLYYADQYVPFPLDLATLTKYMSKQLGFEHFEPEAGIVNFYHMDSTLGGHTDHSEFDMDAPLFSISFGQTAIFLIGGPTKSTKPVAMFVNSGDVIVMSGSARLAYHAVPRIIPAHQDTLAESFTLPNQVQAESVPLYDQGKNAVWSSDLPSNVDEYIDCPPKKIFKHTKENNPDDFQQNIEMLEVKCEDVANCQRVSERTMPYTGTTTSVSEKRKLCNETTMSSVLERNKLSYGTAIASPNEHSPGDVQQNIEVIFKGFDCQRVSESRKLGNDTAVMSANEQCADDSKQTPSKAMSEINSRVKGNDFNDCQRISKSANETGMTSEKTGEMCVEYCKTTEPESIFHKDKNNLVFDIQEELEKLSTEHAWQPFADYLKTSRINMNVRQVLPKGKTFKNL